MIVLTTAGSEIDSPLWLRSMTRHFSSDTSTEVVLGFAAAPPYDDRAMGARARSFDFVADSAAWVSPLYAAIPGEAPSTIWPTAVNSFSVTKDSRVILISVMATTTYL